MKAVKFRSVTQFEGTSEIYTYEKDTSYIFTDSWVAWVREEERAHNVSVIKQDIDLYRLVKKYKEGMSLENKILYVVRTGGFGDLLFTTPFVKILKEQYPTSKIILLCSATFADFLREVSPYDEVIQLPAKLPEDFKDAYFLSFEGIIENSKDAEEVNAYELFARAFGYTAENHPELNKPAITLKDYKDEHKESIIEASTTEQKRFNIGIQYSSSSYIRSWKPESMVEMFELWDIPSNIFIFDVPRMAKDIDVYLHGVKNDKIQLFNVAKDNYTMVQSAQVIKYLDLLITPDSALAHVAGGLDVPIIGLFGAFPSAFRIAGYKNSVGLDVYPDCEFARGQYSACFKHGTICDLAARFERTYSPCMDLITGKKVKEVAFSQLKKLYPERYNAINSAEVR